METPGRGVGAGRDMETPGRAVVGAWTQNKTLQDAVRRQLSASRGERLRKKPNLPVLCSGTSRLQNCEKIHFSQGHGDQETNTIIKDREIPAFLQTRENNTSVKSGCYVLVVSKNHGPEPSGGELQIQLFLCQKELLNTGKKRTCKTASFGPREATKKTQYLE